MKRPSIFDEMRRLQRQLDSMFESTTRNLQTPSEDASAVLRGDYREPRMEISETDNEVMLTAELPGVEKEDIKVNIEDNTLQIKVDHEEEHQENGAYTSRKTGFYRSTTLPSNVDSDNTKASYRNGVLELRIPKKDKENTTYIDIE